MSKKAPECPYCGCKSKLVKGDVIYPHRQDLYKLNFYMCEYNHDRAYVGCHKGSSNPLGRLASAELRKLKSEAHQAFDPIWRQKYMTRSEAYQWLADSLGIPKPHCHIGMFDESTCKRVYTLSNDKMHELRGDYEGI